ncbi:MAG: zinc-dependent alcohol dehydrogenase [Kiritimatiellia bacterium]
MWAAQLTGLRKLAIREVPEPRLPGHDEVLVRVDAVGICGSDVHNYLEGGIGSRKVDYPFIPGHEAAGTILALGENVLDRQVGDRIMIEPAMHCGDCDQCRIGRYNTCRNIQFLSSAGELQGCMCERVVIPVRNALVVRPALDPELVALAEPLSVAVHSVRNSIPITAGVPIAVLGAGPIGLCTLATLLQAGADRVYVTDPLAARRDMAVRMGAYWCGAPAELDGLEPLGMGAVFECSGKPDALDQAVELAGPGSKLVITGIPEGNRVSLDISQLRRKEVCIFNVRRQNQCAELALQMIDEGSVAIAGLVTHRFPLAAAADAFDLVAGYGDGVIKAMVQCVMP